MLGTDLAQMVRGRGDEAVQLDRSACDITSLEQVRSALAGADVVVNAAAYTAVDKAESDEAAAFAVNAVGARNVAMVGAQVGAQVVHISTDYVFDGLATQPYPEDAAQAPGSAYGRTKAAGEWAVRAVNPNALVVRTAWLYGAHGPNFVATMLRLAGERDTLTVVDDQIGQPTWTCDVADLVMRLLDIEVPGGYYHATSSGQTSWHGFAQEIFVLHGLDPARVAPIPTSQYPTPARRPLSSVLAHDTLKRHQVAQIAGWRSRLVAAVDAGLVTR